MHHAEFEQLELQLIIRILQLLLLVERVELVFTFGDVAKLSHEFLKLRRGSLSIKLSGRVMSKLASKLAEYIEFENTQTTLLSDPFHELVQIEIGP